MARSMMWANYRRDKVRGQTIAVPSPFDNDGTTHWWYDRIALMAREWAEAGFTDVLFPNPIVGVGGPYPTQDGYGPYDDYNCGDEKWPSRFGTLDQLRRAIAVCHANGLSVHLDHVMHQRAGGRAGFYNYKGSRAPGRFPKFPGCFRGGKPPFVPQDPVPSPADDFSFGDELCPVNSIPQGYVWHGLIDAGDWLFRTTDADGARIDDTKGMNIGFIKAFMNSRTMKDKWFFGEYASGSPDDLNWWIGQTDGRASTLDFNFHYEAVMPMCNAAGTGNFNMGSLAWRGLIKSNPMKAVTFVESMDSDVNGFATVMFNKELGEAYMFGSEGLPLAYIRDYLKEPDCYGLTHAIQNLAWINHKLAAGGTIPRLTSDPKVYIAERTGGAGLIMTLNNDVWDPNWKTRTCETLHPPGTELKDYSGGNNSHVWVQQDRTVTFGIPPAANGRGYGMWAPVGHDGPVEVKSRRTAQTFFAADDLKPTPAFRNGTMHLGRICAAKDSAITSRAFIYDKLPDATVKTLFVRDGKPLVGYVPADGDYDVYAVCEGFPDGGAKGEVEIDYLAPQRPVID